MVAAEQLSDSDPTPGMARQLALHRDGMWSGTVDTDPHATSGWHHHGDFETTLYVVSGRCTASRTRRTSRREP